MAVLAVIGGIDSRLRLGGQVTHEEFGEGTVTRITPKGRITVQFSDMRMSRVCPLNQLKPVGAVVPGTRASGKGLGGRRALGERAACGSRLLSRKLATPAQPAAIIPLFALCRLM